MNQLFMDILFATHAVEEGHFFFTPQWHSCYNILLQVCFTEVANKKTVGKEMYKLVRHIDPSVILAVNSSMAYGLAHEIGARFGGDRRTICGHRLFGYFKIPRQFVIKSSDNVLIVDDGIITGTGCLQAVEVILRAGAKPLGIIAAYSRYPDDISTLARKTGVSGIQVEVLADLAKMYPLVQPGEQTCDPCKELEDVEESISREHSESGRNDLFRKKAELLPVSAYEANWGYYYEK
jgi:hypothetical protein